MIEYWSFSDRNIVALVINNVFLPSTPSLALSTSFSSSSNCASPWDFCFGILRECTRGGGGLEREKFDVAMLCVKEYPLYFFRLFPLVAFFSWWCFCVKGYHFYFFRLISTLLIFFFHGNVCVNEYLLCLFRLITTLLILCHWNNYRVDGLAFVFSLYSYEDQSSLFFHS